MTTNDYLSTDDAESLYTSSDGTGPRQAQPGLVVIFGLFTPSCEVLELSGQWRELGRESFVHFTDRRISRRHAAVRYKNGLFHIQDLGSQNGTYLNGVRCTAPVEVKAPHILRLGATILILCPDVGAYTSHRVQVVGGQVSGPQHAAALALIAAHARMSSTLHIYGESGTGKEHAARAFHNQGPEPAGPFIAVNCATIPEGVAERLLFGAVRGAYSGADKDTSGYIQAADGGTLFFDELAELDLGVQAKLLRVLETREVTPLGAVRARPVHLRLCTATHQDLRALVARKELRADLYFRIGTPQVYLPPLRERLADIPLFITHEAARTAALPVHASFVEACLLRPWPGNIRELLAAVREATIAALEGGADRIDARHLGAAAGTELALAPADAPPSRPSEAAPILTDGTGQIRAAAIKEALRKSGGNISVAAQALGLHRTQLRRWLVRYNIPTGSTPSGTL